MPGTRRGIYIEFVGDELKYVRSAENVMATNTRLGTSYTRVGVDATKGAEAQVAAAVAANRALREQAINLRALAASSTGEERAAATQLAVQAESRLAAATGVSAAATGRFADESRAAERDFGKLTRGALAGAGIFSGLGRSLAFASGGFLLFATGATLIRRSVDAATQLAATQRGVDKQLQTSGKNWAQYGQRVDAVNLKLSHVSGFTNQDLLQSFGYLVRVTGNVSTALRLNAVAADVARGRHIALSSASLALGKALGGSITALRRLGIVVPENVKGMAALNYVAAKFAGQAEAGATFQDKLNATLVDSEEIIGTALLPTIQRLATQFGNWLQKMNETGRLQKDVNTILHDTGDVIHIVSGAIETLDKVTGGFVQTLKLLVEIKFATMVAGWIGGLNKLATSWFAVAGAADAAAAAEGRALGAGAVGGAAGGATGGASLAAGETAGVEALGAGGLLSLFLRGKRPVTGARFIAGTSASETIDKAVIGPVTQAEAKVAGLRGALLGLSKLTLAAITIPIVVDVGNRTANALSGTGEAGRILSDLFLRPAIFHPTRTMQDFGEIFGGPSPAQIAANQRAQEAINARLSAGQFGPPAPFAATGLLGRGASGKMTSPFPFGVPPIPVWTTYADTIAQQIAQVRASMTKSLADDVAVAKSIIARIKHQIDVGHLQPGTKGYLAALQDWASAQQTLDNAEQQAAANRAAAAAKLKAIASSYTTPIDLQIAEVQAQMTTSLADDTRVEKEIIAAARRALASGKKNKQGRLAALQTILGAQQALQQLQQSYALPQSLQLGLARAQAFGGDTRKWLLKMKAAALKAYKAAKGNVDLQLQILNEITSINSQLASGLNDAQAALGLFKQANLKKLTAGLGLTAAQRQALQARLSQLGPAGTVPGQGTGAAGYAINPDTGRPIVIHHTTKIDGKTVEQSTTTHQQRRRRRNPRQRRGPNAGTAAA